VLLRAYACLILRVQICDHVKNDGWSVTRDPKDRVGSYASKHDQWVSYDDVSDVTRKVRNV